MNPWPPQGHPAPGEQHAPIKRLITESLTERDLEGTNPLQDLKNNLPPVPDFLPVEKAREQIEKVLPDKLHPLNILGLK